MQIFYVTDVTKKILNKLLEMFVFEMKIRVIFFKNDMILINVTLAVT